MIGSKRRVPEKSAISEDKGKIAEAWSAWGMGEGSENVAGAVMKTTTMDGKPALSGFTLSQSKFNSIVNRDAKKDAPKRWKGPVPPSGYVLKRHVFQAEDENAARSSAGDSMDSGLGLDLKRRQEQRPSRSFVPKVLPPSSEGKTQPTSGKMLAKDGTELNFHAVRESMKSRFVTSAGTTFAQDSAPPNTDDHNIQNMDTEEWVQVTVTPWVPARLLCKRWGVPVPSTAGMSATSEAGAGGRVQSKEETYFRQTIYEPALAGQRQKDGGATKKTNGSKEIVSTNETSGRQTDHVITLDTLSEEVDRSPPPVRPSDKVFQAIFDAESESDMDISSSSSDDETEREDQDSSRIHHVITTTTTQQKKEIEESAPNHTIATMTNAKGVAPNEVIADTDTKLHCSDQMDNHDAPSVEGSGSSSSQSSKQSSKRTDEDRKKRKRKEKRRRKHNRRRDFTSESDEESIGYDSDHRKRRKQRKKHKHRSRPQHKKRRERS
mmetsp:Transcript_28258/g.60217  ORF Transcript_28258/g.60217 Transcript_28258/m.60217 type:complete len:492 (-) Transcript_28258:64-1539(-)